MIKNTNETYLEDAGLSFGPSIDEETGIIRWSDCGGSEIFARGGQEEADAVEQLLRNDDMELPGDPDDDSDDRGLVAFWARVERAIATVCGHACTRDAVEAEANANLFAAAPETAAERDRLREALRVMVAESECYCADNVAAKGVCGHCQAREALSLSGHPSPAQRVRDAAPELLEALLLTPMDLHKADERGECLCSQCEFRRAARAAITKAEGQEEPNAHLLTPCQTNYLTGKEPSCGLAQVIKPDYTEISDGGPDL